MYISSDEHKHERTPVEEPLQKFSWRNQPNAELFAKEGVEYNDYPSQIMKALNDAGIFAMPEYVQLNNEIARLRLKIGNLKIFLLLENWKMSSKSIHQFQKIQTFISLS